jgi:hypothetical protein
MNTAASYAQALFALIEKDPNKGTAYLANLSKALERRGHSKLLSRIFSEYRKLELRKTRRDMYARVTPERERTRVLLELYRTLITN